MPIAKSALLLCLALAGAAQADVTLKSAWMRPAPQGADAARAYVDIVSDVPLTLVGASTPVAQKVLIVRVGTIGDPSTEKVVKTLAVPAQTPTRLAYLGDHLRLVKVKRDLANGTPVPITLKFKDTKGKPVEASTQVTVRGLLLPNQVPEAARDAPAAAPAPKP